MTKRMNIPDGTSEIKVCSYERIKATNRPVPVDDLQGRVCTCGIDFSKITDFVSVNLHFRDGNIRYDLNHSWLCLNSKDLPRIKAPWREWANRGLIDLVDDVEIHPETIVEYIEMQKEYYSIKMMAIDDFRYALLAQYLKGIGFDAKAYKNLKLVRPSDIMKVAPVIDSCFANDYFAWGDNPTLRWAVNNTKMIRYSCPFYKVYRINTDTVNEYYIIDTKNEYTEADIESFTTYLNGQLEKVKKEVDFEITADDREYMLEMMLVMYSNPLCNKLKATDSL